MKILHALKMNAGGQLVEPERRCGAKITFDNFGLASPHGSWWSRYIASGKKRGNDFGGANTEAASTARYARECVGNKGNGA